VIREEAVVIHRISNFDLTLGRRPRYGTGRFAGHGFITRTDSTAVFKIFPKEIHV
jgi:hypothetical protein